MTTSPLACQRDAFSLPEDVRYLNCAYMAPLARAVETAALDALVRQRDPSGIASNAVFFEDLDRVRRLFARLIGTDDWGRVALVPSVSYALQIVTTNARAKEGQNVVTIGEEFSSAVLPWHRLGMERRVVVRTVDAPRDPLRRTGPARPARRTSLRFPTIASSIAGTRAATTAANVRS